MVPCYNERPNVAPMIAKLDAALRGIAWEVIYVDDNSPDGTAAEVRRIAQTDPRVRCIRRIGRRGLASAVIEGALSSSARLRRGDRRRPAARRDPAAGHAGGAAQRAATTWRWPAGTSRAATLPACANRLAARAVRRRHLAGAAVLPVRLTDPMSGFFMLPRDAVRAARERSLTGQGFKILLDLVLSAPAPLRVIEVPCAVPRARRRREQAGRAGADAVCRAAAGQDVRRAAAAALHFLRAGRRARRRGAPRGADLLREATGLGFERRRRSRRWWRWCSISS